MREIPKELKINNEKIGYLPCPVCLTQMYVINLFSNCDNKDKFNKDDEESYGFVYFCHKCYATLKVSLAERPRFLGNVIGDKIVNILSREDKK